MSSTSAAVAESYSSLGCGNIETITSAPSNAAFPPSCDEIAMFMGKYAGKFASHPLCGLSPDEYTGLDYALVLYACIPSAVNLSQMSWASHPLPVQLNMNLRLFCDAAARVGCPATPYSSLQVSFLQPNMTCLWHHLKVQHWLYFLGQRCPPSASFDPCSTRLVHQQRQLGEPFAFTSTGCPALLRIAPATVSSLEPTLAHLSARRPAALASSTPPAAQITSSTDGEEASKEEESAKAKGKRLQSYSKPWNLPSIAAAKAKKAKEDALVKKRVDVARKAGAGYRDAFCSVSSSLGQQLCYSTAHLYRLREKLLHAYSEVIASVFHGLPCNFNHVLEKLEKGETEAI